MELEHLIRQPSAATFPRWGRLTVVCAFGLWRGILLKAFAKQKPAAPALAGTIGLLALVHTTRLTGGYDWRR